MTTEIASAVILMVFTALLLVGAVSTFGRHVRYRQLKIRPPLLLYRDRDLLVGLAIPFLLISMARAFNWNVRQLDGSPQLWWLLMTGIPPIYALARYCYFELYVIERPERRKV
jgi:hypothetical protein